MAAVTGPQFSYPPPAAPGSRARRRWLIAVALAWIVVVAGLAYWSVDHDPATVPEQRTIAQALPDLQRAAGVVFAAAGGPGRAVVLGELEFTTDCRLTPVRPGVVAVRDVTVHVRTGAERTSLEAISAGLPASYRSDVAVGRGGTRFTLHADAGDFIGIDADGAVGAPTLTLRLSTDCRPGRATESERADPPAGPAPAALGRALLALGVKTPAVGDAVETQTVTCPSGAVAGTYTVDGVPLSAAKPQQEADDLVRSDPDGRAYRTGTDSVVVVRDGQHLRVAVSTAC
jgi:hypothetical protein